MRFLIIFFALATSAPIWAGDIQWRSDLEVARSEARQTGKLLLMHFYSDQCVWCDRLEAGAFRDGLVQQTIVDRYIPVKIHGPSNPAWVQAFRIQSYPSDVLLTSEGDVISRLVSPQDPVQFVAMLERPGRPAGVAAQPRQAAGERPTSVNLLPPSARESDFGANTMDLKSQITAVPGEGTFQPVGPSDSRFHEVSAHGLNPPANSPLGNAAASSMAGTIGGEAFEVAQGMNRQGFMAGAQENSVSAQPVYQGFGESTARSGASHAGTPQPSATSTLPSKGPMLDGYCPVSMIEKEAWVVGKREFGVIHLGEQYYFADRQAQEKFLQTPERYAPVLNGIDIVRFIDERKIVIGSRAFGWTDPDYGRVFLFSSEETANRFNENFESYSQQALGIMDQVMADYGH